MRRPSQYGMNVAAMGCAVVLLLAGTARLFHTNFHAAHTRERAVSEAGSFLTGHWPEAVTSIVDAPPALEMQGPDVSRATLLFSCGCPRLQRLPSRAPPAWL